MGRPAAGGTSKGSHVIAIEALGRPRVVTTFEVLGDSGVHRHGDRSRAYAGAAERVLVGGGSPIAGSAPRSSGRSPGSSLRRCGVCRRSKWRAPAGLDLCEAAPALGTLRCAASGASIDARGGQEFVLHGEAFLDSQRFRLDDRIGNVTIHASPARRSVRTDRSASC